MLLSVKPYRVRAGFATICALGTLILACHAQESPATYPVRGVVLNSLTKRPIARALVDGQSDAALTDNDGRFEINLTEGMTQINVRRPGYNNSTGAMMMAHPVKVGPDMHELTFYLTPQASIVVHVAVSGGDAADGIRFIAYRKRINQGHGMWAMQGSYTTDSDGNLRLMNLDAPAAYILCSTPAEESTAPARLGKTIYGYPPVCYPGVTDLSTASPLPVSPGQQVEAEINLARQPFYPVSILLPNRAQGQPTGVTIADQSWGGIGFPARVTSQQGIAEANLPNGHYYAESRSNNGKTVSYGRVDFQVTGGPVMGLSLVVHPLNPIVVEIHRDFTANQPTNSGGFGYSQFGGLVSLENDTNPGLNLNLIPVESSRLSMGNSPLRHPDSSSDSSHFEMDNVLPGTYRVETSAYTGYVASIGSGGADLAREPLVVGAGGAVAPIEITLRNDSGSISGTVNQSSPPNSASSSGAGETSMIFAYAVPQFPTTAQIAMSVIMGSGQINFGNLAPGTYRVAAFDRPEEIDVDDPQTMARLTSQGQAVTVDAGSTASVQLDLIQTVQNAGEGQTP
jgi:hypothetical protein